MYNLASLEVKSATRVQILDEDVYLSIWANAPEKDINPSILRLPRSQLWVGCNI